MPLSFDPTSLSRYGGLALIARETVEGFLTGVHKSPFKGYSVEFAEHRQYYPGDEIRHVDWRVLGKTDRYFVKEFEEETNLNAYLLLHQLDAVGCVTHDAKLRQFLPPRANAKHLLRILQMLEATTPGGETA